MALLQDRNTKMQNAKLISVPLAASAVTFAGGMAVVDANGYGASASTALNLTYLGRFEEAVDNTGGANGAKTALVRRGKAFKFNNDATDPVTQASLGKVCYIVDDETVAINDGTGTRSAAGIVVGVDSDGIWVE